MEERKDRRWLKIVALLLALGLAMAWGMVVGGGLVYAWTHWIEQRDRPVQVRTFVWERPLWSEQQIPARQGALIVAVTPDSPAEQAGLREGDRIVAVDGQSLGTEGDLSGLISQYEPGDRITLKIERPGEGSFEVRVRLAEHPDKAGKAYLGVKYTVISKFEWFRLIPFGGEDPSRLYMVPGGDD